MTKKLAYGLGLTAVAFAAGCSRGGGGGDTLAVVNGDPITMDEFHSYLEHKQSVTVVVTPDLFQAVGRGLVKPGMSVPLPVPTATEQNPFGQSLAFQALRDLVQKKIILQIAKDDGVYPTAADVDKELAFRTKLDKDFVKRNTQQGLTLDKLRNQLTLDVAGFNILTKNVKFSSAQIDEFIKTHPERLKQPPQASLDIIYVQNAEGKAQVDKALATGDTFKKVAIQYSIRRNQPTDIIPDTTKMREPYKTILENTAEQRTSDWFSIAPPEKGKPVDPNKGPFAKIYVTRKLAAKDMVVDDLLRQRIQRAEMERLGSTATDINKRVNDKLRNAKVEVSVPYLKEQWNKEFRDFLKEAPAATTSPTDGPPAPSATPAAPSAAPAKK